MSEKEQGWSLRQVGVTYTHLQLKRRLRKKENIQPQIQY
jgi:hypothetical protein